MMFFEPIQVNLSVKKRDSLWIQVCPNCQQERSISYAQAWNIKKNICKKECRKCQLELGFYKINLEGLNLGRKYHDVKKAKFSNDAIFYVNLFQDEAKKTEIKKKQRLAKLGKYGEKSNAWLGGRTNERRLLMKRDEYRSLRKFIFERDNYTCQICFKKGGYLEMDHIKEWCNYPELRYDPKNCRILCKPCHIKTPNYGNNAKRMCK